MNIDHIRMLGKHKGIIGMPFALQSVSTSVYLSVTFSCPISPISFADFHVTWFKCFPLKEDMQKAVMQAQE